jgi:mono/diheme cytochrome c family protein
MRYGRWLPALAALFVVAGESSADEVAEGRHLVETNCARCHAIGRHDKSPYAPAPPFREVVKRYDSEALAEAFAEGVVTGHPEMPEFEFSTEQISALIAYLNSLK